MLITIDMFIDQLKRAGGRWHHLDTQYRAIRDHYGRCPIQAVANYLNSPRAITPVSLALGFGMSREDAMTIIRAADGTDERCTHDSEESILKIKMTRWKIKTAVGLK
jgi:hypothetical protein